jgi:hypothetical protein
MHLPELAAVGMVLSNGKEWPGAAVATNATRTASRCYEDREQGPQGRLAATGSCADQICTRRLGLSRKSPGGGQLGDSDEQARTPAGQGKAIQDTNGAT